MKVIAAYLLAVLGGKSSPSSDDIKNILKSVGADAEQGQIDKLLSELKGKDVFQVIEAGKSKLAAVPIGGGAGAPAQAAPAAETKKEEKKDDKKDDKKKKKVYSFFFSNIFIGRGTCRRGRYGFRCLVLNVSKIKQKLKN